MLERGSTLRTVQGPAAGVAAQAALLTALAATVGLSTAGLLVGAACGLTMDAVLARALWRDRSVRLGPASWVTLARATLAVGVAALTAESLGRDMPVAPLVALAAVALVLDYVDGWIARRTRSESALGARMDGEVDAFLRHGVEPDGGDDADLEPPQGRPHHRKAWREPKRGEGGIGRDGEGPGLPFEAQPPHAGGERVEAAVDVGQGGLCGTGENDAIAFAPHQLGAEPFFQLPDLVADGAGRDAQLFGGARQAAGPGGSHQRP